MNTKFVRRKMPNNKRVLILLALLLLVLYLFFNLDSLLESFWSKN
ncbi:MAG: hypothetical protein U5K51_05450 [Flavobacteriaceae bacterium]|nr:hypothetical protein [Flavobacteriaceae bacterium]